MTPTPEQVAAWAREAKWSGIYTVWPAPGEWVNTTIPVDAEQVARFAALAFAAGRERGLEEAVALCEKERVGALEHRAVQMAVGAVECRDAIHALRAP